MGFFKKLGGIASSVIGAVNPLALLGTGAAMGGDVYSAYSESQSQKDANAANQLMAREQMQFQERMSSTAHQREVDDLKKAGLNPLLSANTGASSPGGAMSNAEPVPSIAGRSIASAMEKVRMANELSTDKAHRRSVNADADISEMERDWIRDHKDAYFSSRSNPMNLLGQKAFESIQSSAQSLKRNWREQSFPNVKELFTGPGYMTDKEMRLRGNDRLMKKRYPKHRKD